MFGGKHKKRWHDIIACWHLNGCSPRLPIDFPSPHNLVKWEKCLSITRIARNKNKTWAVKCMSNQPLSLTVFFFNSFASISANSLWYGVAQMLASSPEVGSNEIEYDVDCSNCGFGCFPCNNTNECVPQRKNCDGVVDCSNSWDERNCGKCSSFLNYMLTKCYLLIQRSPLYK